MEVCILNILVIGKGAREHALVKNLSFSSSVKEIHAIYGNEGMKLEKALCHPLSTDFSSIDDFIKKTSIDLVVIGPENELALGLADRLREKGLLVFGPSQKASQLESSKLFAKKFMQRAQVPTASFEKLFSKKEALEKSDLFSPPYVLKADGLAAGKGVTLCQNKGELEKASQLYFEDKIFGSAGTSALLEEFQSGWELSCSVLTQGEEFELLPFVQDNKRLLEGNKGPNTGGMGAVGPLELDKTLKERIQKKVLIPTLKQMKKEKLFYRGVLYVGLMITSDGPKVIEYNVRFGDPEAQALLPLLDGDWAYVFKEVAEGKLPRLKWKSLFSTCLVLASENYPSKPLKEEKIEGDLFYETPSSYFLHAGTKRQNGEWITQGGRVLNAVALNSTLKGAVEKAYLQASKVQWKGLQIRKDIGRSLISKN